jgi:hypothetical protein
VIAELDQRSCVVEVESFHDVDGFIRVFETVGNVDAEKLFGVFRLFSFAY